MHAKVFSRNAVVVLLAITLGACGSLEKIKEGKEVDYKKSRTASPLEIPPDLTSSTIDDSMKVPDISISGSATYSDYTRERTGPQATVGKETVLPGVAGIQVQRDGDKRWLVVAGEPTDVWPRIREFWLQNGFLIRREDPRTGILETDWAENRADIPQGPIRSVLSKAFDGLYSAATRDKFRVRLETGAEPGTTEVYLTHRGAEEVIQGDASGEGSTLWRPRPADPELEAEMLRRMMVFMGVEEQKAKTMLALKGERTQRAWLTRTDDGGASLRLSEEFSRAWRRTGIALDRVGFTVEDRNRSKGIYYVRYVDPEKDNKSKKGLLSKLAFWSDDDEEGAKAAQYLINLVGEGEQTNVVVLNAEGQRDRSRTAAQILTLLHEQLK